MIFAVARAFGKLPHEVRRMTVADFCAAVAFLEIVAEDEAR